MQVSEEQFGGFVEGFDDAEDDEEIEEVQQEVAEFTPSWDEVLFSGPFVYVEANEQYADQVPNPEHPIAQDWDFYLRHGEYEGVEGLRSGELTWIMNEASVQDLPGIYDEPDGIPSGHSFAVIFGPQDEYIQEYPEVRQALAFVIDTEMLVETTEPHTTVDEYAAGINASYLENFIHDDVLDAMTNYAPQDTDAAQSLLEDVGFELDGGQWYTPDDEV